MSNPLETEPKSAGAGVPNEWDNIRSHHVVRADLPVCQISRKETWNKLSESQKHFIHHFSRASWSGFRICCSQVSEESPDILRLLLLIFSSTDISNLKRRCHLAGLTPWEWDSFTAYTAYFLTNTGNYLALGDMKFIPGLPEHRLDIIVRVCPLKDDKERRVLNLWDKTRKKIYSLSSVERRLDIPPNGLSAYYSNNIRPRDVQLISDWMTQSDHEAWNTRVWKTSGQHGDLPEYELRIASARPLPTKTYCYENKCFINVKYGDHREDLENVVTHLRNAIPYADNEHRREMLNCFIDYFETGSIESHKRSQIHWLQQGEPVIEVNIGFMETNRDPQRCRAEFEGYVAILNQTASKQMKPVRDKAEYLLSSLPWPKDFHAEKVRSTDFSCFEIFTFTGGSIPAGVNLPNYEDVRLANGTRNICFLDVLYMHTKDHNFQTTFLCEGDALLAQKMGHETFLVQVAFHDLLGHQSGKLFMRDSEGRYNFPHGEVRHPITGELVTTCYEPGETWQSVFGDLSSSFEECRAECVGLFFSTHPEAMEAVGYTGQEAEDLMYVNWLMMIRAGFLAIEIYYADTGIWPQEHAQGRFAIFHTLLAASELDSHENAQKDGNHERKSDFIQILRRGSRKVILRVNRNKIRTVGVPALKTLLMKLQVYRCTADVTAGREFFTPLTTVPKSLLEFKGMISRNRRPKPMFVQAHTSLTTNKDGESEVILEEFSPTLVGIIESCLARFRDSISDG
ncbi:hypothetical protein R1sor_017199 [Riccia sorocarpa]|uniref:Dipeptidyl peptidase III n=1 Tax=Riccia sorocarpa TaxID=122646 RepID=A0ABD3IA54_9MARC